MNSKQIIIKKSTTGDQPAIKGFIIPLSPAEVIKETIHQKPKPIQSARIIFISLLERFKAIAKGKPRRHIIIVAKGAASFVLIKVNS